MFHSYSILNPTLFTTPKESLMSMCYLINDYFRIALLHIFVYERAELSTISLEFTKAKLFMLNN